MVNLLTIFKDESLHLADISRQLNMPHPTARLHLNALEKKGILKKTHKGRLTLYSLNLDNPILIQYLAEAEKHELIQKCENNLILKELTSKLQKLSGKHIIIFGSAAQTFNKANDIDVIITGKTSDLKELEKKFNKPIQAIQVKQLKDITSALKSEILKKHLIIKGTEDVVRWLYWKT